MKKVQERMVGDPVTRKEEYMNRSAVYWADEINVPVLILHGDNDKSVSVQQAKTLAKNLERHQKPYKYVEFPNGEHGLKSIRNEYTDEIIKWFNFYLTRLPANDSAAYSCSTASQEPRGWL